MMLEAKMGDPRLTVLLVDDNTVIHYILVQVIEKKGHRVLKAENGLDAVKLAITEHPHLILMDINLPQLDGLAATKLIRARPGTADMLIIAFSAIDSEENRKRAVAAGCNGFVKKPLEASTLENLLDKIAQNVANSGT
jgi:two-component system, cell cycle response regulator DivK